MSQTKATFLCTGFDCRSCANPIPTFANPRAKLIEGSSAIHVMCPHCGHSAPYAARDAYRFPWVPSPVGASAPTLTR